MLEKSLGLLKKRISSLDWDSINKELLENGFVITGKILTNSECSQIQSLYSEDELFRSTIDMKRYNFGKGTYRYFNYPLPSIVQTLREKLYENIFATANEWADRLRYGVKYPHLFSEFKKTMQDNGQTRPTPLILHYGKNDYNCLHQDINNDLIFPFQIVFGLSSKDEDYEGGQLILTQQRPRMQTIPHIITIPKGAAVIFSSNFHPQKGAKGFYRTVFKHGVGKVEKGNRFTLGIVFHDYRENNPG